MNDDIEYALSVLMDEFRDTPLTSADIRRETIKFVLKHCDVEEDEVTEAYDNLYARVGLI